MSMFFQSVGVGTITTIVYVFVTMLFPFIIASYDWDFVFSMAYLIGTALFVAFMICWARGVPCPFAL